MLFVVRYTAGPYAGLKSVNASDDDEALAKVRAWARHTMTLPMFTESYRIAVSVATAAEEADR